MPSAWPASSSRCSKFGSLITPKPIRTAAAIATSSTSWNQRGCLWRRTISQPASTTAAASHVHFTRRPPAGSAARTRSRTLRADPEHGRAGAADHRVLRARLAQRLQRGLDQRAQPAGGGLEVVDVLEDARRGCRAPPPRAPRACAACRARRTRGRPARRASSASSGTTISGGFSPGERLDVLARPGHQRPLARAASRSRPRRARIGRSFGIGSPDTCAISRSAAAASLDPPAMPAAIGIRLAISIRTRRPVPAGRAPGTRAARAARGSRPRRPGRRLRRRRGQARVSVDLVGEVGRLDERDERVQAVGARGADEQAEVDLARG